MIDYEHINWSGTLQKITWWLKVDSLLLSLSAICGNLALSNAPQSVGSLPTMPLSIRACSMAAALPTRLLVFFTSVAFSGESSLRSTRYGINASGDISSNNVAVLHMNGLQLQPNDFMLILHGYFRKRILYEKYITIVFITQYTCIQGNKVQICRLE